jgi:hypothetical protein
MHAPGVTSVTGATRSLGGESVTERRFVILDNADKRATRRAISASLADQPTGRRVRRAMYIRHALRLSTMCVRVSTPKAARYGE